MRVVVCEPFGADWLARVAVPGVAIAHHPHAVPPDVLAAAEVLYTGTRFPSAAAAPRLRWVQLDTAGADHVDPAWRPDVAITSIGGVSARALAEYVLLMLLGLAHRLPELVANQRARGWPADMPARWAAYRPRPVAGTTLVVVGYGRLGREIGRLARAFDLEVIGVRRLGDGGEAFGVHRLHDALARADWVVVVTPLTPETRGLIDAAALAATKPGAGLVNVGRGGVVDEEALLAALDAGHLGGVVADVFAAEPLPADSPLWTHPRVLVTPHVAGLAPDYAEQVERLFAANLARYVAGEPLLNLVDRARGY